MPLASATAPGKIILFGEHAVVYNRPAVAIPVHQVQARALVAPDLTAPSGRVWIEAPDIQLSADLATLPTGDPLKIAVEGVREYLKLSALPAARLQVRSTIPVAAGLGSGAAVSVAVIRALAAFLGSPLPDDAVCALAYRVEQRLHGTPSGIDNTVVTYARPICFQRGQPFALFPVARELTFVIADTGIKSSTAAAVGAVREAWKKEPARYEQIFDEVATIVMDARLALESGSTVELGRLMNANHQLLKELDVSSPELDRLVQAAQDGGAAGAKLSGGGRGGNMIALVEPERSNYLAARLSNAGAVRTLVTHLPRW